MTFNEIYITYKCKKRVFYRTGQIKDALDKIQFFFISSGMTISPKELAEIYDYIIKRSMDDIIAEM